MDYRSVIESKYNRQNWQALLYDIFRNKVQFWQQPQPVSVDKDMAKRALYTGKITLPDGHVIAIYEVELSDSVIIERNRAGIRNLLLSSWRGMGCSGAFMFCFRQNEAVLRFSYVSESFAFAEDGSLTKESTDTKRFTYLLGEGHRSRTAIMQFEDLKKSALDLKAITKAFSVEALSDLFFKEYKKQYEDIIEFITGKRMVKVANKWEEQVTGQPCREIMQEFCQFPDSEKAVRDYVKKLMGRLVFIQFLQKKGWMGCSAGESWNDGDMEFVQNLFANTTHKNTFVDDVLEPLFNDINTKRIGDIASSPNVGSGIKIPYLNGGLFEKDDYDMTNFPLPAKFMKNLLDFFASYNFTIDENDPDDAEIGVDPEMLGRIFENLLEDNKDKGAFYTPKEIVQYMCRESLIAYLQTNVNDEQIKDAIRQFVTTYDAAVLSEELKESVDQKLKDVKICDPAIGSGAFPMGMLRELYACRKAIEGIDDEIAVSIKTHIIQNNIYGVDIEKGAVDIARLRFWLALIVDEKNPHALPNMDFKIMQGNSLLEQYEGVVLSGMSLNEQKEKKTKKGQSWQATLAFDEKYALDNIQHAIKEYYLTDDHNAKLSLRGIINENIRSYIINLKGCTPDVQKKIEKLPIPNDKFFLWHIYFKEVFDKGGFDIVIGNPPYVEFKNMSSDVKKTLGAFSTAKGKYDLYIPFLEHGFNISKFKGITTYICPTRFMKRDYGTAMRQYINENICIEQIFDFEDLQVFDNAMTYTGIFMFRKTVVNNYDFAVKKVNGDIKSNKEDFINKVTDRTRFYNSALLSNEVWNFSDYAFMSLYVNVTNGSKRLDEICEGIYQGIASGKDDVFFIDDDIITSYNIENGILHRVLKGKDIGPYKINWSGKYVIYPYDTEGKVYSEDELKQKYPNAYTYLTCRRQDLAGRGYFDKSPKLWFELWNQRKLSRFLPNKIITLDNASKNSFTLDTEGFLGTTTVYSLVLNEEYSSYLKYVLGVLNSALLDYIHKKNTIPQAGGFFRYQALFIKSLPIKFGNSKQVEDIMSLVTKILDSKKHNPLVDNSVEEQEINRIVYEIYCLKADEIKVVEGI